MQPRIRMRRGAIRCSRILIVTLRLIRLVLRLFNSQMAKKMATRHNAGSGIKP
jgi:hypothetical protein